MKKLISLFLFIVVLGFGFNVDAQDNRDANLNIVVNGITAKVPTFTDYSALATTATWSALPVSPHAVSRSGCVYIKRQDTAYVFQFGGGAGAQFTTLAKLNLTTNTWSIVTTAMPTQFSAGAGVADGDSVIYMFGGNSPTLGKALKYNIVTNTFTALPDMPTPATDFGVVKYQDTVVYVIAGGDGLFGTTINNVVRIFKMRSATWTTTNPVSTARGMLSAGIFRDTIIAGPGWTGAAGTSTVEKGVINPTTLAVTWSTIAVYPTGGITRAGAWLVQKPGQGAGIVFSGGAIDGGTVTAATNIWNFCTQSWQTLPANSQARSNLRGTGANDSIFYLIAGYTTVGVGTCEKLTFSSIDGTCSSPPPPAVGVTSPCRNGLNKSIPDNNPTGIQDTIIVNIPTAGNILDINVKVDTITHTWDSDLDVTIIHGAIEDTLFHDVGSSGDNFIGCILNDSATTAIQTCTTAACAPFTGSWIPANLLANYNGTATNGLYILRVVDDLGGDVGTLQAWCITVTYQTITGNIETTTIPSKYALKQNYPNPFNPSTKISYNLPKASDVKLVIYDLLGREVKTLVNEYKQAGIYNISFDGSSIASGVYFYKIVAGDFTDTKKMLLVK